MPYHSRQESPRSAIKLKNRVSQLKLELQQCYDENTVLRAWNRQLDDALTEEMNAASTTNEKNEEKKAYDGNDPQSSKDKNNL